MDITNRWGSSIEPQSGKSPQTIHGDPLDSLIGTASQLAHKAGRGLAVGHNWLINEAIEHRPLTTLGVAFGIGVFTGWLVKRR